MKIEKLSENSIRCTLNRADLDSRELKISELAYGTEKAKNLFKDMIAQASYECGFDAEDIPLMIEAIPISPDCIVLVITKVEDPEELDTRFSKFAPADDDDDDYADMLDDDDISDAFTETNNLISKINDALNADDTFIPFMNQLGKSGTGTGKTPSGLLPSQSSPTAGGADAACLERLFSFKDFSYASAAAAAIGQNFRGNSRLYKNISNMRYYLLISSTDMRPDEFAGLCNILSEYGLREKFSYATLAYLDEHDEVIIKKNAIKVLSEL